MNIEVIWKENYRALVFYAGQKVKQADVAEDIVTEAFLKLLKANDDAPKAFLYKCVYNACIDHIRGEKIHDRIHGEIAYSLPEEDTPEYDYDYMWTQYIVQLTKELKKLSPQKRRVMQRLLNGQTTKEIAIELGISEQTVRNLKTKAIEQLGNLLKVSGYVGCSLHIYYGLLQIPMTSGVLPLDGHL